ncbi:MAG: hypothetical protein WC709_09365 [Thermoleophilia bacterium]
MPEAAAAARDAASGEAPAPPDDPAAQGSGRLAYGLGLAVQTLLWFLLFLAIVVAVLAGHTLTEFRYVGF